jgi:hypothetical protein
MAGFEKNIAVSGAKQQVNDAEQLFIFEWSKDSQ